MATRCKYTDNNSLDCSKLNYKDCNKILDICEACEHYFYCYKVSGLLARQRELED